MTPRMLKKGPGPGRKVAARGMKITTKQPQNQIDATMKVEEVEVKKEIKVKEVVNDKLEKKLVESEETTNGSVGEEEGANDIFNGEDGDERLDLDDNEPDYEAEEETAVDYDEKMISGDDQEVDEEGEDEVEEDVEVEEEEGDLVDEEIEAGGENAEDESDHENTEEHDVDREEEEHHEVVKERRKRKEFEVFVGGLDKGATEDVLRKVFNEVGQITEIRLLMNSQTKKNKGFAFLRFATVEQAKRAATDFKSPVVNGKQCGVTPSQDTDTLFLGNICKTWTKEHLKQKLKNYGINNIEDLILVEDTTNEGMNRGFAFLEFSSRSDAMDAYRLLRRRDILLGVDRAAKVAFADSFIEPDDEIMLQVKTVFVDGIPPSWDEERIKAHVKKFGKIEKIELARNMPAAKRKDFGFVTFDTHEAAVTCAENIKNAELGEGDNKVKVRARLSRPLQRGRGKHIVRGDFRIGRVASRDSHVPWSRVPAHRLPIGAPQGRFGRGASFGGRGLKSLIGFRDRRTNLIVSERARQLPPSVRPSYKRRPQIPPVYAKSSSKKDYDRSDEPAPRHRAVAEYGPRVITERRPSYGDDYSRGGYSDVPPRTGRRSYIDEGYGRKLERPLPSYRNGRERDYDSISGFKRPFSALDDVHSQFSDVSVRHSRARLDDDIGGGTVQYEDSYGGRLGRSHTGYSSRGSFSEHDSHGPYGGRQGLSYSKGSLTGSNVDRMYSSSGYASSYLSRDSDVIDSSYSMYSGRSLGDSDYLHGSGSGSYY